MNSSNPKTAMPPKTKTQETAVVQEPKTSKFDGMPRKAIDAAIIDIVAPANELPLKIIGFLKTKNEGGPQISIGLNKKSALEKIILILKNQTGNNFSLYKKNTYCT